MPIRKEKLKNLIREELSKVLNEQAGREFTCLLQAIGATGGERIMSFSVQASSPAEAAKSCILKYHKVDEDPSMYSLSELQGKFTGGTSRNPVHVLAVIEGTPNIPLKMTPTGLK